MRRYILSSFVAAFSLSAWAAPNPEFYFQPTGGQHVVHGQLRYDTQELKFEGGGKVDQTNFPRFELAYFYGISDDMTAGVRLAHSDMEMELTGTPKDEMSGLENIVLFFNGRAMMNKWSLRYGLDLSLSPGDSEDDNMYTGGHHVEPYIGADFELGSTSHLGLKVARQVNITDRSQKVGDDIKNGERNLLAVYYECHPSDKTKYGLAVQHEKWDPVKVGADKRDVPSILQAKLYAVFGVQDNLDIVPEFAYGKTTSESLRGVEIDSTNGFGGAVKARYVF